MSILEIIGLVVISALAYVAITIMFAVLIAGLDFDEYSLFLLAWMIGGVLFIIVLGCWYNGQPFPFIGGG